MTHPSFVAVSEVQSSYIRLFDAMPGSSLLLQANPPHYTVLAASPQHLKSTGMRKEDVIGKDFFVAFPANPTDVNDTGAKDLQASLEHVLHYKELHSLPVQRYVGGEDGTFTTKFLEQ